MGPKCLDKILSDMTRVIKRILSIDKLGKFNLTIRTNIFEILIAKDQNFPLGSKQSKFIQTLLCELGYLDTRNFSAEVWTDVASGDVEVEEMRFLRISTSTRIDMV